MSGETPGVDDLLPPDALERLAEALGGRVLRRREPVKAEPPPEPPEPEPEQLPMWWDG